MKKKTIYRYIFGSIELVGALTIACVWLGVLSFRSLQITGMPYLLVFGMLGFATVVMLVTIFRRIWPRYTLIFVLGALLLVLGGSIAFFFPQYFFDAYALKAMYWIRVSMYSLPAICIEGGILTLYIAFVEKGMGLRTDREKLLMAIAFVLYAIMTVTTNFMTINGTIAVQNHVWFAQAVTVFVGMVTLGIAIFHGKTSIQ